MKYECLSEIWTFWYDWIWIVLFGHPPVWTYTQKYFWWWWDYLPTIAAADPHGPAYRGGVMDPDHVWYPFWVVHRSPDGVIPREPEDHHTWSQWTNVKSTKTLMPLNLVATVAKSEKFLAYHVWDWCYISILAKPWLFELDHWIVNSFYVISYLERWFYWWVLRWILI